MSFVTPLELTNMMKTPSSEDLKCLNCWPVGSKGESQEQAAIDILLQAAKYVGFGRMTQLAEGIEEVWRDPETAIPKYQEVRKAHFENCGWVENDELQATG